MQQQKLGTNGPSVSWMGLGCMGMSGMYGQADRKESMATIHEALDSGINLLDTGDFYGMGHNELLIREALQGRSARSRSNQRQIWRPPYSCGAVLRLRRSSGSRKELLGLQPESPWHRLHRYLSAGKGLNSNY